MNMSIVLEMNTFGTRDKHFWCGGRTHFVLETNALVLGTNTLKTHTQTSATHTQLALATSNFQTEFISR